MSVERLAREARSASATILEARAVGNAAYAFRRHADLYEQLADAVEVRDRLVIDMAAPLRFFVKVSEGHEPTDDEVLEIGAATLALLGRVDALNEQVKPWETT